MTLLIIGGGLLAPVALARCFFLARWRAGWAMYLANVVWEVFPKKGGIPRTAAECLAALLGLGALRLGGAGWGIVCGAAAGLILLEAAGRLAVRRRLAEQRIPRLAYSLEGPFVERLPRHRLGVLWVGHPVVLDLTVLNTSRQPWPEPLRVRLDAPPGWLVNGNAEQKLEPLPPAGIGKAAWTLRPDAARGGGELVLRIEGDRMNRGVRLPFDGCRHAAENPPVRVSISRYPGGRRSAWVWRGDMDLYDVRSFQSIEGLETALDLAARYAVPQTLCLSTRLTLDERAAREFADHEGAATGAEEIPRFIEWVRSRVALRHRAPWPARSADKPYVLEIGNHGHLHYDTAAAAAPENGWTSHAKMGAGRYPWMGEDPSSFGEQRDNILEAARCCERAWGFVPRSWAKPGRCNDADTPRAAAAAGCEVLSGSDIRARDNVLFQPPPHHPGGTDAVELTSRYPPDPQNGFHFFMLMFWLHRSRRRGLPMVYMCHQHMRQWDGPACTRFAEALIRRVLLDFHGEFYVDTLFGVGQYWREALSPRTRRIRAALDGTRIAVENRGDADFRRVPVDLELADGSRSTVLADVAAGQKIKMELNG
ncbi:MAG: hypothetical protein PHR34_07165 [Kiritimatiellae bacterium]|nr:hypothetical protein [Kiritimatiellia bacterium]